MAAQRERWQVRTTHDTDVDRVDCVALDGAPDEGVCLRSRPLEQAYKSLNMFVRCHDHVLSRGRRDDEIQFRRSSATPVAKAGARREVHNWHSKKPIHFFIIRIIYFDIIVINTHWSYQFLRAFASQIDR